MFVTGGPECDSSCHCGGVSGNPREGVCLYNHNSNQDTKLFCHHEDVLSCTSLKSIEIIQSEEEKEIRMDFRMNRTCSFPVGHFQADQHVYNGGNREEIDKRAKRSCKELMAKMFLNLMKKLI